MASVYEDHSSPTSAGMIARRPSAKSWIQPQAKLFSLCTVLAHSPALTLLRLAIQRVEQCILTPVMVVSAIGIIDLLKYKELLC